MPTFPEALTGKNFELFTLALSLLSCALLAWLANFRLKSLFPQPGRRLLTLFTATQALLLLTNLVMTLGGTGAFPPWLWYLDSERAIPSVHSSIQLLLLASLCCMNGLAAGLARVVERAWWLVLGLVLIFMAAIEYVAILKTFFNDTLLAGASSAFLLWSLLMLWRQGKDRRRRNGLLFLLGGLGLWTVGAFLLDDPPFPIKVKVLEETVETLGVALALAGAAGFLVAHRSQRRFPRRRFLASLCLTNLALAAVLFATHFWEDSLYPQIRHLWKVAETPITLEETVETLGVALALAGAAGFLVAHRSRRRFPRRRFLASLCLTNLALAMVLFTTQFWEDSLYPQIRYLWDVAGTPITVDIDDGALALRGWRVAALRPGSLVKVNLWLHATRPLENDFGFTVQLIDQASLDTTLTFNARSGIDTGNWTPGKLFNRQLVAHFHLPGTAPVDRAQWLTLSFWKIVADDFLPLKISASDYPTLGDTHVILDELVVPDLTMPPLQDEPLATFDNGFALQRAVLPARAGAGDEITVAFQWSSESAGGEDWTQFLHFIHRETGDFWSVDQYPLGLRLPTRLWYAGLQSGEQWRFPVPQDLEPGDYSVQTGLYRLADMERLNVTLTDGSRPAERSIPFGSVTIEGRLP